MISTTQEAIDEIRCDMCIRHEEITDDFYEALNIVIDALTAKEKVQEVSNDSPELNSDSGELISRQMAIEVLGVFTQTDVLGHTPKQIVEALPSAQPEIKPIEYRDCANAMLRMWMDKVVTDGEYNSIMDKLNSYWRRTDG